MSNQSTPQISLTASASQAACIKPHQTCGLALMQNSRKKLNIHTHIRSILLHFVNTDKMLLIVISSQHQTNCHKLKCLKKTPDFQYKTQGELFKTDFWKVCFENADF